MKIVEKFWNSWFCTFHRRGITFTLEASYSRNKFPPFIRASENQCWTSGFTRVSAYLGVALQCFELKARNTEGLMFTRDPHSWWSLGRVRLPEAMLTFSGSPLRGKCLSGKWVPNVGLSLCISFLFSLSPQLSSLGLQTEVFYIFRAFLLCVIGRLPWNKLLYPCQRQEKSCRYVHFCKLPLSLSGCNGGCFR